MTVLDESPAARVPAFVFDALDVQFPMPAAAPVPALTRDRRNPIEGKAEQAAKRGGFVDRRMQRAREQLPTVEAIRRLTIALCDRPYCLSSDEMSTLGGVFVYNDAHGS